MISYSPDVKPVVAAAFIVVVNPLCEWEMVKAAGSTSRNETNQSTD